jgi:hypothetical protein
MNTRIDEAIEQINQRNALRRLSGLPPLHAEQEVRDLIRRDRNHTEDALWRQFSDRVGDRVLKKILARERRLRSEPNWTPRAPWFNGNPNVFYEAARRKRALFERICSRQLSAIERNYVRLAGADTGAA